MSYRNIGILFSVWYLLIGISFGADLDANAKQNEHSHKGIHGIINLTTSPLEFPMQAYKWGNRGLGGLKEDPYFSKLVGTLWGFAYHGSYNAIGRGWQGVYQLSGFWALSSESNEEFGMPLSSENAFDFDGPVKISKDNAGTYMNNKLQRGLMNIVWGVAVELPSNVSHGIKNRNFTSGFSRGTWYSASRTLFGLYESLGFLVPNNWSSEGYAFDYDEPWKKESETQNEFEFSSVP